MKRTIESQVVFGLLISSMVLSPVCVFADDGYEVQYYDSIEDFYSGTGQGGGGYSGGVSTGYPDSGFMGENNGYVSDIIGSDSFGSDTISGYYPSDSGLGSDIIYGNTSTPSVRLWSDEPLASKVTANQHRVRKPKKPISIRINGKKYTPRDTQPLLIEGRVFVPLRFVVEQLGYTVSWDSENMTAEINDGAIVIEVGSYTMWKYDEMTIPTDTPAFLYQGTLMVGLRQIGNALNYDVSWNASERLVTLDRAAPNKNLSQHNVFDRSRK